jgi:DNA polymerase-3 subunit epsilon/oligoribonuclease
MWGLFLDLETTGLSNLRHRILDIAVKVVDLNTGETVDQFATGVRQPLAVWEQAAPDSLLINGYTWEKCCEGMEEREVADSIAYRFTRLGVHRGNSVFICQNPSFDRGFFAQLIDPEIQEQYRWPYHWLDLASMHWAIEVHRARQHGAPLPELHGLSKDQIAAAYGLPPESRPHSAINGVDHLILCYQTVVGFGTRVSVPA